MSILVENHHYVDLIYYNYILKCFVLIDLKTGKLSYQDVGRIEFYVRYFEEESNAPEDNATIGVVLWCDKKQYHDCHIMLPVTVRAFI